MLSQLIPAGRDAFATDFHALSHEVRTPLNHINGFAELLRLRGGLDPTQASYVEAILVACAALQDAILKRLDAADPAAAPRALWAVMPTPNCATDQAGTTG